MAAAPRSDASRSPTPAAAAHDAAGLQVRPVASLAEYRACAALQVEVWGPDFERVPASMLQVSTYVGGLCIGAFTPEGELCGFVFGLTGTEDGRPMHWSHLLGVKETARNLGVGRLLKERQRELLASRGVGTMCWTFDPLIAKNAHLNLNLLGARVVRFVPDMYGTTESPLHHGFATDRLVVAVDTGRPAPRRNGAAEDAASAPVLTLAPQPGDEVLLTDGDLPARIWIEVPTDFQQVLARSHATAAAWHEALRRNFLWALGEGYVVTGLRRDPLTSRSYYTLEAR
jgi:predicted GNAT superfamily acetyltransferase